MHNVRQAEARHLRLQCVPTSAVSDDDELHISSTLSNYGERLDQQIGSFVWMLERTYCDDSLNRRRRRLLSRRSERSCVELNARIVCRKRLPKGAFAELDV